jgi:hypothetical protein
LAAAIVPQVPAVVSREKAYAIPNRAGSPGASSESAPLPPASALSAQLIQRLAQTGQNQGRLTAEQAAEIKQQLNTLTSQGRAAVPAIRQFLERNQDVSLDDPNGPGSVGYSSLRAGLLDVVKQVGGPESTDTFLSTLRSTADPAEIALLAKYLDEQAPGQYRQEAVIAAHDTLYQGMNGQLQLRDAGPLFQILQQYGDATVVTDLEMSLPQWQYYATLALGALPDGQGIPSLVQRAQESLANGASPNIFTLQVLAQAAGQSPDAASLLVDQAKHGQIPDRVWTRIVEGLAGDQYQLGKPPTDPNNPTVPLSGLKTYHIDGGNQNFYSLPINLYGTPEQMAERRAVVDQLLGATQNPAAVQALQNARAVLSAPPP